MKREYLPAREAARTLRRRHTPAEATLWEALRARRLDGRKFRRQYPVAEFIADFCCPESQLIVEVDGPVHAGRAGADETRDALLLHHGYRVLRLSNDQVQRDLPAALQRIREALELPP
ncbi:MAG: endonuclease domain-containing protein [Chloroflexi bacterium]|nr:endonuclease domain-containing protein [Chloroflexota bacterium]